MKVTAKGKTFTFPDGTRIDDIGEAIDEYFAGQSTQSGEIANNHDNNALSSAQMAHLDIPTDKILAYHDKQNPHESSQIQDPFTEAGRGLVNIPFDVLQGGANLIDALSQAVGGDRLLGDIYRPIDRPTDPYALAGETVGDYLIPGIGAAGKMMAGSLADASNQQGDFAQNAATNAGVNLAAQGLLSAAAKGVGKGITALKGEIAPEAVQKMTTAESMGVAPMTSDMLPPQNAMTRGLTQGGEGALLGTGARRAEQQTTRRKPDTVVKSLTSNLKGRKDTAGRVIDDITQKMGVNPIETTHAVNAIDTGLSRLVKLGTSADQNLRNTLQNLKGELTQQGGVDFDLLQQHRTAFRSNVQGDAMVFPNHAKAMTNSVENAMTKDLRNSVSQFLGPQEAAIYLKANSDYANVYNKVLNKRIASNLNKATREATPELINSVVYSRNASDIKRIWPALDNTGKDAVRAAYISKIAETVGDSPAKFMTQISKLKEQAGGEIYNTVFSGRHMKELEALNDVLQTTKRADSANVVTQTGQALANPLRIGAAFGSGGASLAGEVGFGIVMRMYESKPVRNALLRLANKKTGAPAYERALNNAVNLLRPIIAASSSQQPSETQ
ncbi:hypothetical protein [Candidatus Williamhamiltonella defendens]|uniref:hypothetical protein n=1 Tax=Candidatus Williamhamiltonella defendens TaxID=138072 RepID=UPI000740342B|nr:hypothetical protein [Candidatus Hamiltonella defensa]